MTKLKNQPYYGSQAYRVDNIPVQKPCVIKNSFMSASVRLPWGDTQQVIPTRIMEELNPKNMKFREQTEKKKLEDSANKKNAATHHKHIELHSTYDHERFKFS
ncbi:hypothetical protein V2J66_01540 [Pseudomonas alliivorans]|nr:hypothetical protein [Pseudomonas alliivorans]MEE5124318.1 hypothetical protein [Pseudomonas alliivorans]